MTKNWFFFDLDRNISESHMTIKRLTKFDFSHVSSIFNPFWSVYVDMENPYKNEIWVQKSFSGRRPNLLLDSTSKSHKCNAKFRKSDLICDVFKRFLMQQSEDILTLVVVKTLGIVSISWSWQFEAFNLDEARKRSPWKLWSF